MADKDKKLSLVYSELLTAIDAAKAEINVKVTAHEDAREALSLAQVDYAAKTDRQKKLLAMYPELIE